MNSSSAQSGVVLIVVLMLIAILVVVALESFRHAQVDMSNAYYFQDQLQARGLARSGLNLAKVLLAEDQNDNQSDHLGEPWGRPLEQDDIPLPDIEPEELDLRILDETGKFPINFLVHKAPEKENNKPQEDNATKQNTAKDQTEGKLNTTYARIFLQMLMHEPFSLPKEKAEALLESIKNWIDEDTVLEQEAETEDDFYLDKETSYKSKNSPLDTVGELLLIQGITDKLYYGSEDTPGLRDLVTVYSPEGKININTASQTILQAMVNPSLDWETAQSFAKAMLEYRREAMHYDFLKEKDWYRNRMVGYNDIQLPGTIVETGTDSFQVTSCGKKGLGRSCLTVFLRRTSQTAEQSETPKTTFDPLYRELH
ncbi:MAG: type II secretion system minor pseudopilin GspK [Desulfohalobiaceae bacterium]|nr:type II secretion system minor pseudopilin GspK [Desulfohalobiaceae bacterium]